MADDPKSAEEEKMEVQQTFQIDREQVVITLVSMKPGRIETEVNWIVNKMLKSWCSIVQAVLKSDIVTGIGLVLSIFPWHTLPNLDHIYAISEVIILSNNQHQHKKKNIKKQQD